MLQLNSRDGRSAGGGQAPQDLARMASDGATLWAVPMADLPTEARPDAAGGSPIVSGTRALTLVILVASVLAWAVLAWLVIDMGHPLAQLTMPATASWSAANVIAICAMWAVMMAAMMLPSALPMILSFARLGADAAGAARARSFVAAYLLVWFAFSLAASAVQWLLQALDWVNPMVVSKSARLSAALLLIAGIYQFSPLKKVCLASCRTPMGFLLGQWRAGVRGAFVMGLRHGLFCLGCCWALMALLFVGGVMNLPWVAALAIVVAIEKLAPHGQRLALLLGLGLIAAGALRLWAGMA
jgi:predicted metal-binding membrane protein